jgi:hypothetical protein
MPCDVRPASRAQSTLSDTPFSVLLAGNDAWERHNKLLYTMIPDLNLTSATAMSIYHDSALWSLLSLRNELDCLVRNFAQSILGCDEAVNLQYLWSVDDADHRRFLAFQGLIQTDFVEVEDWREEFVLSFHSLRLAQWLSCAY